MEQKDEHDINQKRVVQRLVAEVYFFTLTLKLFVLLFLFVCVFLCHFGVIQFIFLHETTLLCLIFFFPGLIAVYFTAGLFSLLLNKHFT